MVCSDTSARGTGGGVCKVERTAGDYSDSKAEQVGESRMHKAVTTGGIIKDLSPLGYAHASCFYRWRRHARNLHPPTRSHELAAADLDLAIHYRHGFALRHSKRAALDGYGSRSRSQKPK